MLPNCSPERPAHRRERHAIASPAGINGARPGRRPGEGGGDIHAANAGRPAAALRVGVRSLGLTPRRRASRTVRILALLLARAVLRVQTGQGFGRTDGAGNTERYQDRNSDGTDNPREGHDLFLLLKIWRRYSYWDRQIEVYGSNAGVASKASMPPSS